MLTQLISQKVYSIPLGPVNVFLLESQDGLVLIDTGTPGSADRILKAASEHGSISHILVTHWHPDHMGSLAALKHATGAQVYAHPIDAPIIREGGDFDPLNDVPRPFAAAPGMEEIFQQLFNGPATGIEGAAIDHEINAGDELPFLLNLKVIFAPGHSDGQLVFLLEEEGGVLFAADTCSNMFGLNWSVGYENFDEGKRTLQKLCGYDFRIATFGHGDPILNNAADEWRKKWGSL